VILSRKILPDGREALLIPLLFGRSRITVGELDSSFIQDSW